jgi:hypothetical protein
MPRYGYGYPNPEDMMSENNPAYNPYRPGIDWPNLVAAIYKNLAEGKEKKKQARLEEEQRWREMETRALNKKKVLADIAESEANAERLRRPPEPKEIKEPTVSEYEKFMDDWVKYGGDPKQGMLLYKGHYGPTEKTISTEAAAGEIKDYRKAKSEIEKRYSMKDIEIDSNYKAEIARIRRDPKLRAVDEEALGMSPYGVALGSARDSWKQQKELLPKLKQKEIDALDEEYGKKKVAAKTTEGTKIHKQAKSSSGKVIDVWSSDGGKTWVDKQGNLIPINK